MTKKKREDLSEFNFAKFAATYFVNNTSSQFSKRPLKTSLLDLPVPADQISSQVREKFNRLLLIFNVYDLILLLGNLDNNSTIYG